MAKKENVTEELKANNQLEWVQKMNNIKNRAEEIAYNEIIYRQSKISFWFLMKFEKINDIMLLIVTLFNLADGICQIRKKVKMSNELIDLFGSE